MKLGMLVVRVGSESRVAAELAGILKKTLENFR